MTTPQLKIPSISGPPETEISQARAAAARYRQHLSSSPLLRILAPSPEERRLADIYSKKGLAALTAELN